MQIKYADVIKSSRVSMIETLQELVLKFDEKKKNTLNTNLKQQIYTKNWLWSRTVRFLYSEIFKEDNLYGVYKEFTQITLNEESKMGFLHMSQEFGDCISYKDVCGKFEYIDAIIVSRCLLRNANDVDVQVAEDFSRMQAMQPHTALSNR